MKKILLLLFILIATVCVMTSCVHEHSWVEATCTDPKTCSGCGAVEGTANGHVLSESVVTKATSYSAGTIKKSCTKCNYSFTEEYFLTPLTAEEIYDVAEISVGEILTYKKNGSGLSLGTVFAISADGRLVTNYHVIEGAYSASVTIAGNTYSVNKVLAYDKNIDLAVLKINATGLTPLEIQTNGIKGGATVYAVGSSEGYTFSFSTGVIASPNRVFDGISYIQHEAAISHGNSGGPLFNSYGEVIGINTLTNVSGQNLNFAISCKELDNLVYGSPLTMERFYEMECDPFNTFKDYIMKNGKYDYSDSEYYLLINVSYSSDYTAYYFYAYYEDDKDEIRLSLFIDDDYLISFWIDSEISGKYFWTYVDYYDNVMYGYISADTYSSNSLLGYSYNNISGSSLRSSVRELASEAVHFLCLGIEKHLYDVIGVSAYDFGFYCYD